MSSFIGHSLAALTVLHSRKPTHATPKWWSLVLVGLALAPDVDYVIPQLRISHGEQILRTTHSLVGCLAVPILVMLVVWWRVRDAQLRRVMLMQAFGAGISHIVLDLLVGVMPLPLLYPFSMMTVHLPFGLLPSAGRITLNNFYFYRNTLIELGILLPIWLIVYSRYRRQHLHIGFIILLVGSMLGFLLWSVQLPR